MVAAVVVMVASPAIDLLLWNSQKQNNRSCLPLTAADFFFPGMPNRVHTSGVGEQFTHNWYFLICCCCCHFIINRSASPGSGYHQQQMVDGSNATAMASQHSPSLNSSSHTMRSGSLTRPMSPSPSLTSDKVEQDFQVKKKNEANDDWVRDYLSERNECHLNSGSAGAGRRRAEETSTIVRLCVTLRRLPF